MRFESVRRRGRLPALPAPCLSTPGERGLLTMARLRGATPRRVSVPLKRRRRSRTRLAQILARRILARRPPHLVLLLEGP